MTNRLGIEMLTGMGMNPVEQVRLAGELGCVSISTGAARFDFTTVGIFDYPPGPRWSLADDPALRREFKAASSDHGVHIGLGEGFGTGFGSTWPDPRPKLDLMAELGALRINAVSMDFDEARANDELARIAEEADKRSLSFTIEFAPTTAVPTLGAALAAIAHIGRDNAGVLLDAMHVFRSGATVADVAALDPALIGYAQVCDAPWVSSFATYMEEAMFERQVPDQGELPLREFIAALPSTCEIGLEVPRLAELRAGLSPHDHAAQVVAAARALGA